MIIHVERSPEIYTERQTLLKFPIEDNDYTDDKYVKATCRTAYLGILKAIDE